LGIHYSWGQNNLRNTLGCWPRQESPSGFLETFLQWIPLAFTCFQLTCDFRGPGGPGVFVRFRMYKNCCFHGNVTLTCQSSFQNTMARHQDSGLHINVGVRNNYGKLKNNNFQDRYRAYLCWVICRKHIYLTDVTVCHLPKYEATQLQSLSLLILSWLIYGSFQNGLLH